MRLFSIQESIAVTILSPNLLWFIDASDTTCDTSSPIPKIPSCAWCCVEPIITKSLIGGCFDASDLSCLCNQSPENAFDLNSAVAKCFASSCSTETAESLNANPVCSSNPEMAFITTTTEIITVITATITKTATSTQNPGYVSNSITPVLTSPLLISSITPTSSLTLSSIIQSIPTTSSNVQITSSSSFTIQPASSTAAPSATPLSKPAIAGISLACGAAALFLAGFLLFFYARKIRKKKLEAQEKEDFETGDAMSERPDFVPPPPGNPAPGLVRNPGEDGIDPNSQQPRLKLTVRAVPSMGSAGTQIEHLDRALSPESDLEVSPESIRSHRIPSQLLPDKPDYALFPEPLRISNRNSGRESYETIFDDSQRSSNVGMPFEVAAKQGIGAGDSRLVRGAFHREPNMAYLSDPRAVMYALEKLQSGRAVPLDTARLGDPTYVGLGLATQLSDSDSTRELDEGRGAQPFSPSEYSPSRQRAVSCSQNSGVSHLKSFPREAGARGHSLAFETRVNHSGPMTSPTGFESVGMYEDRNLSPGLGLGLGRKLSPIKEHPTPSKKTQEGKRPPPWANGSSSTKYQKIPLSTPASSDAEIEPMESVTRFHGGHPSSLAHQGYPGTDPSFPTYLSKVSRDRSLSQNIDNVMLSRRQRLPRPYASNSTNNLLARRRGDSVVDAMETDFNLARAEGLTSHYGNGKPQWKIVHESVHESVHRGQDPHQFRQGTSYSLRPPPGLSPNFTREGGRWQWPAHDLTPTKTQYGFRRVN